MTVYLPGSILTSDRLTVNELCQSTGISAISVRRAILFWVLHGVLKEIAPDTFYVLERAEAASPNQGMTFSLSLIGSAIAASAMVSAPSDVQSTAEQAESEMQIYWYNSLLCDAHSRTFIVGMLTNLGVLPVERIHSMLMMFVPPPNPYNRTEEELRSFLADEVKKGKLEFVKEAGGYKLVQP
jgi:anaphase-promoting complex subunit 2